MILFSVAFSPINLNWQKLPQFLRKARGKTKITIGQYQSCLFLVSFSKRLCFKHFYGYLEYHNILYPLQFGFRQKCSNNHAPIQITESIGNSTDNNEFGCGIFIDLKKAFDTVNQKPKAYDWFQLYLSNREQFVCINGHNSYSLSISCGVPHGSVLGPLLFLLYIDDLPNTSKLLIFHLFADDTDIYCSSKDLYDLELILNQELHTVFEWMKSNR